MLSEKTVYTMTSMINYKTQGYLSTKELLQTEYPTATLLWPDELFSGREDWLRRFPLYLQECDCGLVIPDWQGMVGYGVVTEAETFLSEQKPVYCLAGTRIVKDFAFEVVNEWDWKRYARVITGRKSKTRPGRHRGGDKK